MLKTTVIRVPRIGYQPRKSSLMLLRISPVAANRRAWSYLSGAGHEVKVMLQG